MAALGDIYIGETGNLVLLSSYGRELKIITEETGRSQRTYDGTLKTDITSIKYRFEIPYQYTNGDVLAQIITLYDLHTGLELKIYDSPTTWFLNDDSSTPIVKINPVSRSRFVLSNPVIWKNVNLVLDEI